MSVIEARDRLSDLRNRLAPLSPAMAVELDGIIALMHRKRAKTGKAPSKSVPMTHAIGAQVRSLSASNPALSNQDIANRFGINPGRVSEALAGKW